MSELLNSYLSKLAQSLGIHQNASTRSNSETSRDSSSAQPSAYLDKEHQSTHLGKASAGSSASRGNGRPVLRGKVSPSNQPKMAKMEQPRPAAKSELNDDTMLDMLGKDHC